jgi:hypothetical protein
MSGKRWTGVCSSVFVWEGSDLCCGVFCCTSGDMVRWDAFMCFASAVWHIHKALEHSMPTHTSSALCDYNLPLTLHLRGYETVARKRNAPDHTYHSTLTFTSPPLANEYLGSTATTGAPPNPASTPHFPNTAPPSASPPLFRRNKNRPYASTLCTSAPNTPTPSRCSYATRGPPLS